MINESNNLSDTEFIESVFEFLMRFDGITRKVIEKQLIPEEKRIKPKEINDIYKSILSSAQNVQMSPNVIGGAISGEKGNIDPLEDILYNFNPQKVHEEYSGLSNHHLYKKVIEPTLYRKPNKIKLWLRYTKTILSAASFLTNFTDVKDFYNFIDKYYENELIRPFLPMLLSFEIDGFGFSLACDFLKEMGYVNYGKPDTHIKDIFISLSFMNKISKYSAKADYYSLQIIDRLAKSNDMNSYAIDKLLWLIGSGYFYLNEPEIKIGNNKKEFIKYIKDKYANNAI